MLAEFLPSMGAAETKPASYSYSLVNVIYFKSDRIIALEWYALEDELSVINILPYN